MSTIRWIIETKCDTEYLHGHDFTREPCNGVYYKVVDPDNLPPEAIERAAKARWNRLYPSHFGWDALSSTQRLVAMEDEEAAVRAFLSDPEPGDQT